MYYVYVIQSDRDNSLYTDFTTRLKKRINEHNSLLSEYTRPRGAWRLIYFEGYIIKEDALGRETFLKSGSGKKYLDKQLKNFFEKSPRKKL